MRQFPLDDSRASGPCGVFREFQQIIVSEAIRRVDFFCSRLSPMSALGLPPHVDEIGTYHQCP